MKFLKSKKFIYLIIFLLLLILCFFFPYTHDDWAWGSQIGIERLETNFKGYNGRWFGNFFVLALTRSNLLKTFVMALMLTGTIYLINRIIKSDKKITVLLTFFLLLATPYLVFRQAIAWTAGFANYAASIFFVLLFINYNKDLFEHKELSKSKLLIPLFLILGFITTLFVEHVTIYTIMLSVATIIYTLRKLKKVYGTQIAYLIGSISGTILMFSNSAYSSIATGEDTYRTFGIGNFINSSIKSYFETIYKELVFNNHILNILLGLLISIVLYKVLKDKKQKKNKKALANIILFVVISFVMYSCLTRLMNVEILLNYTKYFDGLFTIIYCLAILFFVIFFINKDAIKRRMIFTIVSIVIMTLPLFVVTPIGSRCFLPTYIMFILFAVDLLYYVLSINKKTIDIEEYISKIIICLCGIFYIYLTGVYGYIYKVNNERLTYLKDNIKNEEIILPRLPYQKYMWYGDPANEAFMERFKLFYNVDNDTEIKFVSLKEWKKQK